MFISSYPFSVITVTFNRQDLTMEFVDALAPYVIGHGGEWIIVDNKSSDNTVKYLTTVARNKYPALNLTVISLHKNIGMGSAYNIGLKLVSSVNTLMICNDVKIIGDPILPVLNYLNENRLKGENTIVGPRLIMFDTGWNSFNEVQVIPYIEGWFVAGNTKMLRQLGWDGNIFLDYEDIELSWRAHNLGIGLAQIDLPVMHMGGQSFMTLDQKRLDITLKSQSYFMRKWGLTKKV